ncbi:unnamed protein product [Ilex paraguariensis]|uniref:Uncharacterized protein n=1 Tax=Ilex paraguariensis TaxID=185542 RepID=A0ABC8QMI5_9AQUA
MIVPWCSQLEVLSHPSLGCFVTHCGWNSTLESLVTGVPVVAFPHWSDQTTNARMIEDVWKTGVRVKPNGEGTVEDNKLKQCIEMVMGGGERGKEMRNPTKVCAKNAIASVVRKGNKVDVPGANNDTVNNHTHGVASAPWATPSTVGDVGLPEIPKREEPKGESLKREAPKREACRRKVPKRETSKGEVHKREASKRVAPMREAPRRVVPKGETPRRATSKREAPKKKVPKREAPRMEVPKREEHKVEVPKAEASKRQAPKGEVAIVT